MALRRHVTLLLAGLFLPATLLSPDHAAAQLYWGDPNQALTQFSRHQEELNGPLYVPPPLVQYKNPPKPTTTPLLPTQRAGERPPWEINPFEDPAEVAREKEKEAQLKKIDDDNKTAASEERKKENLKKMEAQASALQASKEQQKSTAEYNMFAAIYNGDKAMLNKLFREGIADPNALYQGYTPLHYAAALRKLDMVMALLGNAKVDIGNEQNQYFSLLHWGAYDNHIGLVQTVLQRGANPNIPDAGNRTPYDYAKAQGNTQIMTLLSNKMLAFKRPAANTNTGEETSH